jgi:glutaredoxin
MALACVLALSAAAARADWLVMRDGARLETLGPWSVDGKQVVFKDEFGVERSLRLKEVDLEASRAATEDAEAARRPPDADIEARAGLPVSDVAASQVEPGKEAPALVLSDEDVGHVGRKTILARAEAQKPRVTLYMTSWCPYCRKARTLLRQLGVPFVEKDIEKNAAAAREYQRKGNGYTGVPLIDIDGTIVRGFSEARIRQLVARLPTPGGAELKPTPSGG